MWSAVHHREQLAVVLIARKGTNSAIGTEALADAQVDAFIPFLARSTLWSGTTLRCFQTVSEMISWERWEGTIEYTFMAPVRRGTHMVGTALFSLVYGLLHTAVVLVVIVLVFDLDMGNANYVSATAVLVAWRFTSSDQDLGAVLPLLYPERGARYRM
ncbi:MAG: hypothetical protein IPN07_07120 [Dehalococcoidia bacterium]|nr:hypothetical protein [Dehalococcoidia bacterium]